MLGEIIERRLQIDADEDRKAIFDMIVKDGGTTEKRLRIDIYALRDSFEVGELEKSIGSRVRKILLMRLPSNRHLMK